MIMKPCPKHIIKSHSRKGRGRRVMMGKYGGLGSKQMKMKMTTKTTQEAENPTLPNFAINVTS